jgi:hypothetical protein
MPRIEALFAELSSVNGVATCAGLKMRGTAKLPHKPAFVTLLVCLYYGYNRADLTDVWNCKPTNTRSLLEYFGRVN